MSNPSLFITESQIDKVWETLSQSQSTYQKAWLKFQKSQPVLSAYLFSEHIEVFTNAEQDYLLFLATILSALAPEDIVEVSIDAFGDAEEKNWELMQSARGENFQQRLDIFFEGYLQEDLLAFVEDALQIDDDSPVTVEGRSAMFILLKTYIDLLFPTTI